MHTLVQGLPADQITVQKLADELGMSEHTLARKVRDETGTAVATYTRRIKLSQVSERLTLTSVPVKMISDELGFSSDSNMRRMFKELTELAVKFVPIDLNGIEGLGIDQPGPRPFSDCHVGLRLALALVAHHATEVTLPNIFDVFAY